LKVASNSIGILDSKNSNLEFLTGFENPELVDWERAKFA